MSEKEVIEVIESFFDTGKTKNFSTLRDIQLNDSIFSSFSDVPPYDLKDYSTTIILEELRFSSISDYNYEMKNTKVTILENTAILTCELNQKGILELFCFLGLKLFCFLGLFLIGFSLQSF